VPIIRFFRFLGDMIRLVPSRLEREWNDPHLPYPGRPIIILVTGFAAGRRNVTVLRKRFLQDEYNVLVISLQWKSFKEEGRGLNHTVQRLSEMVLRLKKDQRTRDLPVYLVAHSAGGLVARYYIQTMGGYHYCDALVTLGTPHFGTRLAWLGLFSPLVIKARILLQLLPHSKFMKSLNDCSLPVSYPALSILSKNDVIAPPGRPLPFFKEVEVSKVSHVSFLTSKLCYGVISEFLKSGALSDINQQYLRHHPHQ